MATIYLVPGFGTPKDIFIDPTYRIYFNEIFKVLTTDTSPGKILVLSGGNSDCFPPYNRIEAQEMHKYFLSLTRSRALVARVFLETQSISTVENQVYTKQLLDDQKINYDQIVIFCEKSRRERVGSIAQAIFGKKVQIIDFAIDQNHYTAEELVLINQKEDMITQASLEAIGDSDKFQKLHQAYLDKYTAMRQATSSQEQQEIQKKIWKTMVSKK